VLGATAVTCGVCRYCREGRFIFCPQRRGMGHGVNGAFARYVVVRPDQLYRIPDHFTLEEAAISEPFAAAVQAVTEVTQVRIGETALISGPGPIGLLCLKLLAAEGVRAIVAGASGDELRLAAAREFGAALTIDTTERDLSEAIREATDGVGVDVALECGLPPGALNVVPGLGEEAGAALAAHAGIDHVSFTGSVATGALVQSAAAKNAVPVTLELGGKSPQIVFADADLDAALPFLVNAGIQNAGQTCSAASRILVERPVFDRVRTKMAERYRALAVGPAANDLDVGPLISRKQKQGVDHYLGIARDGGLAFAAEGALAADAPKGGHYVRPTLVDDVPPDHALAQEEIFGPVQVLIAFDDEADAIRIANGTKYGLVAGVWTRDGSRALRMARALRCGQVFVNNYGAGGGIELPFGGVKHSGHGREKGFEALYGFSTLKTIAIQHG